MLNIKKLSDEIKDLEGNSCAKCHKKPKWGTGPYCRYCTIELNATKKYKIPPLDTEDNKARREQMI